jgi:hypothetical protein
MRRLGCKPAFARRRRPPARHIQSDRRHSYGRAGQARRDRDRAHPRRCRRSRFVQASCSCMSHIATARLCSRATSNCPPPRRWPDVVASPSNQLAPLSQPVAENPKKAPPRFPRTHASQLHARRSLSPAPPQSRSFACKRRRQCCRSGGAKQSRQKTLVGCLRKPLAPADIVHKAPVDHFVRGQQTCSDSTMCPSSSLDLFFGRDHSGYKAGLAQTL